ncbi:amidohydrolase [Pseudomonas sp. MPFS]|uniref:M20 aminoacylase family protein n=1 Tax=Pseudomonas sp. MPFS TaxID=2795724 RepID=UPI001F133433|nr:M20 aminoacylase family protein [Pseudomonas sp. MPFS]UMZ11106.1 amidohydrolase [Pseudomonas sp. MPFS]
MTIAPSLIERAKLWRRALHAAPELGFQEVRTADKVAGLLQEFGIDVHRGLGGTGVVGTLRHGQGPSIGIRADMDALPIQELGTPAHQSAHSGCMHACGHDGHTAILLATACQLARTRRFNGTVHFVFQPAEEGLGGARRMIDDGLFQLFPMEAIYGLHNWPGLPAGTVAINPGPMMASMDTFQIRLVGQGCHAAMPERGADPILAGAELVVALQSIPARRLSPLDSAVISVTQFNAGEAVNVIANTAQLKGTVRCLQPLVRERVQTLIREFVEQLPSVFGVRGELCYEPGYPVTENHPKHADLVRQAAIEVLGEQQVVWGCRPSMASEDFAYLLDACPGAYLWLGVDGEAPSQVLHNPYYDFNDQVIQPGVALWVALVERSLLMAD